MLTIEKIKQTPTYQQMVEEGFIIYLSDKIRSDIIRMSVRGFKNGVIIDTFWADLILDIADEQMAEDYLRRQKELILNFN